MVTTPQPGGLGESLDAIHVRAEVPVPFADDDEAGTATPADPPLPCDFNRHGLGIWSSSDGWTVEQMPAGEVQVSLSDHRDPPGGETFYFEADLAAAIGAASRTPGEPRPETLRAALAELVALKDGPRDRHYRDRKEQAWANARAALATLNQLQVDPSLGVVAAPPLRGDSADPAIKRAEVAEKANEHARVRLIELLQAAKEDIARNTRLPEVLERVAAHLRPIPVHPGVARLLARCDEIERRNPEIPQTLDVDEVRALLAGGEPQ